MLYTREIDETLREVDQHMDNIRNLLPGLSDDMAEDFLMAVQTASSSLEEAHQFLLEGGEIV
jgi:hypothetical protein